MSQKEPCYIHICAILFFSCFLYFCFHVLVLKDMRKDAPRVREMMPRATRDSATMQRCTTARACAMSFEGRERGVCVPSFDAPQRCASDSAQSFIDAEAPQKIAFMSVIYFMRSASAASCA